MSDQMTMEEARFVFLIHFAPEGLRTLKDARARISTIQQFASTINIRCLFVPTSGPYDLVTMITGTDQQAYQFHLYLRSRPAFDLVDKLRIEAGSTPEAYMALIDPLTKYHGHLMSKPSRAEESEMTLIRRGPSGWGARPVVRTSGRAIAYRSTPSSSTPTR